MHVIFTGFSDMHVHFTGFSDGAGGGSSHGLRHALPVTADLHHEHFFPILLGV
jgi:hypothetical protein